jgi:hypothetical protein
MCDQGDLFDLVDIGLARPPRMMWVYDHRPGAGDAFVARFRCAWCGRWTDWLECLSRHHAEFGIPCPVCSGAQLAEWLGSPRRCFSR